MNPESPYTQPGNQPPQYQPVQPQQSIYTPLPSPQLPPIIHKRSKVWVFFTVVFFLTTLAGAGFGVWAWMNYVDQKENTDSKITAAVGTAVKKQQDTDAANFLEQEKQPNRQFAGPDDYGRVSFDYPKTWSIYVDNDASKGGTFMAYFNPVSVPPIANTQLYALRVEIQEKDYDQVLTTYDSFIKKGSLTSSSFKADDQTGTRLDGNFTKDLKGSAVLFKIRDKTVIIKTDAEAFKPDFEALIKTITFNK